MAIFSCVCRYIWSSFVSDCRVSCTRDSWCILLLCVIGTFHQIKCHAMLSEQKNKIKQEKNYIHNPNPTKNHTQSSSNTYPKRTVSCYIVSDNRNIFDELYVAWIWWMYHQAHIKLISCVLDVYARMLISVVK